MCLSAFQLIYINNILPSANSVLEIWWLFQEPDFFIIVIIILLSDNPSDFNNVKLHHILMKTERCFNEANMYFKPNLDFFFFFFFQAILHFVNQNVSTMGLQVADMDRQVKKKK